jgi:hypothetical protein
MERVVGFMMDFLMTERAHGSTVILEQEAAALRHLTQPVCSE